MEKGGNGKQKCLEMIDSFLIGYTHVTAWCFWSCMHKYIEADGSLYKFLRLTDGQNLVTT